MNVPAWAGFVTYLPDDEVATGTEIAVYGGRNVAVALGEIFSRLGGSGISDPSYGGEMGWDFAFRYGDRHSCWCRVQSFHPIYWLLFEGPSGRRAEAAHRELWSKFSDALEQDPRFDQILWRSSKDGPPDWDEFTITDDLPKPKVLDDLPVSPLKPRPKAAGGALAPTIVGVWCVLTVVTIMILGASIHGPKKQQAYVALAVTGLIIGLAGALRIADRFRRTGRSPNETSDSPP
jgi:hypothetical protein